MDVTNAYMYSVKNLGQMFEGIQKAQVPPRFTHEFLKTLGFKSTNDRSFTNVLKGLGFLDASSVPTQAYRECRDKKAASAVLARQTRQAYKGLFLADENAQDLSAEEIKGKLRARTGKEQSVVAKMASTFKALVGTADFKKRAASEVPPAQDKVVESPALEELTPKPTSIAFAHTIYINLPASRDIAVYDAIFKSIREHLL
ncbi:MAG: DUF5343 domain-containing protein [Deltaproteobacteria bacterium]|nr:DUF5343 domain-containing protein [Deltaproteobacteria bacterium]MBK8714644.1 DUF5343 domain-containing protein [Deltaproteobacteria bacterium]MBP7291836.1 DUF5343 domain-containing protein [Nannocystaceae bacterium]